MTDRSTSIEQSRVVVGVDGSEHSERALAWAISQARLTRQPVTAIATWLYPQSYGYVIPWPDDVNFAEEARKTLTECVERALGAEHDLNVTLEVFEGHAALVLEDESRSASLLVVGSRGHGEFAGMLLGSVSEHLATHAHCPVVIIRGDDTTP